MGKESIGVGHTLEVARSEEQVEVARGHLDLLLTELDRRRHVVIRLRQWVQGNWPIIGGGLVTLAAAVTLATWLRRRHR